jgi:hypothetical protein
MSALSEIVCVDGSWYSLQVIKLGKPRLLKFIFKKAIASDRVENRLLGQSLAEQSLATVSHGGEEGCDLRWPDQMRGREFLLKREKILFTLCPEQMGPAAN